MGFFATVFAGCAAPHGDAPLAGAPAARQPAPDWNVALAAWIVAATYGAQLSILAHAAATQSPFPHWFFALPFLTIDDRAPAYGHAPIGVAMASCALVQTGALVWLYVTARGKALGDIARIAIVAAALTMAGASLLTPVTTSFDMYAYAGAAHAQNPYRPSAQIFGGSFSVINRIYGVPIFPTPYGPVWVAFTRVLLGGFSELRQQLFALRAVEIVALGACALALRRLRFDGATIAIVALNPALLANFVLDGHNDLIPIALVLWGIALGKKNLALAITLGILAGNVKLPFLLIATLIATGAEAKWSRYLNASAIALGGIALSVVAGGRDYLWALHATSQIYGAFSDPATNVVHVLLALAAALCIALAIHSRRYLSTGAWAFAGLGATFFGWYVPWGLPYAVRERRWLPPFLISLPLLTFFLATGYASNAVSEWSLKLVIIGAPISAYIALRNLRRVKNALA
jgi:hypothetical protein